MQSVLKENKVAALLSAPAVKPRESKMEISSAPVLDTNFPPPHQVAVANTWHIDRYYFEASEDKWYLIVDAKVQRGISRWTMLEVSPDIGKPIGEQNRVTSVDLWGDRFADRPFDVRAEEVPETFEWFKRFVQNKDVVCQMEMFDAYADRLRYYSSYQALVRLGLIQE